MTFDPKKWAAVGLAATQLPLHDQHKHIHHEFDTSPLGSLSRPITAVTTGSLSGSISLPTSSYGGLKFV